MTWQAYYTKRYGRPRSLLDDALGVPRPPEPKTRQFTGEDFAAGILRDPLGMKTVLDGWNEGAALATMHKLFLHAAKDLASDEVEKLLVRLASEAPHPAWSAAFYLWFNRDKSPEELARECEKVFASAPRRRRGRPSGTKAPDWEPIHAMAILLATGKARTVREAARKVSDGVEANSLDSAIRRLERKFGLVGSDEERAGVVIGVSFHLLVDLSDRPQRTDDEERWFALLDRKFGPEIFALAGMTREEAFQLVRDRNR